MRPIRPFRPRFLQRSSQADTLRRFHRRSPFSLCPRLVRISRADLGSSVGRLADLRVGVLALVFLFVGVPTSMGQSDPVKAAVKTFDKACKKRMKLFGKELGAELKILDQQLDVIDLQLKNGLVPSVNDLFDVLVAYQESLLERQGDAHWTMTVVTFELIEVLEDAGLSKPDWPVSIQEGRDGSRDRFLLDLCKEVRGAVAHGRNRARKTAERFRSKANIGVSVMLGDIPPPRLSAPSAATIFSLQQAPLTIEVVVAMRSLAAPESTGVIFVGGSVGVSGSLTLYFIGGETYPVPLASQRWSRMITNRPSGPTGMRLTVDGSSANGSPTASIFVP